MTGQCMLLGANLDNPTADTWLWNGNAWTELSPASAPNARYGAAAATLEGRVAVFGGYVVSPDGSSYYASDTWVWGGGTWTQQHPGRSPSPRYRAAVATLDGKVILFGGASPTATFGDTWEWDGASWTELHPAQSPLGRSGAVAATLNGEVVLFGGWVGDFPGEKLVNETWTWDGTTWTERSPGTSPSPRNSATVSTLGDKVVLFGGKTAGSPQYLNDTWEWDGFAWTQLKPESSPPARGYASAATLASMVVVAGGLGNGSTPLLDDVWVWDGTTWMQSFAAGPGALDLGLGAAMSCY